MIVNPQIGDRVRLKNDPQGKKGFAAIVDFLPEIKGGVQLDKALDGYTCWNVEDLRLVNGHHAVADALRRKKGKKGKK